MRCAHISFLLGAVMGVLLPARFVQAEETAPRTISVGAEGRLAAEPDLAILHFAVVTAHDELSQAKQLNDARTRQVLACLREFKIDPKDIKTSHVHISTRFREYRDVSSLYYEYSRGFRVAIRKLDDFESLFNAVLGAGANRVDTVLFDTSRRKELEAEALDAAIIAAKEKATRMAKVLGQKIGRPRSIDDQYDYYGAGYLYEESGIPMGDEEEPTFAYGEITVKATVTIEFELLDDESR